MTGTPLPDPGQVTVSVANGTGVTNQAATTSAALGALGFHMMELGDTPPVGQEAETVVYYGSKSSSVVAAAQLVAHSISGRVVLGYNPSMVLGGAEVTVDTGTSFSVNAPKSTTSTSTSTSVSTPNTTTTTTTSSSSDLFALPTSSNEALKPWDPRSCTPSGGEGP